MTREDSPLYSAFADWLSCWYEHQQDLLIGEAQIDEFIRDKEYDEAAIPEIRRILLELVRKAHDASNR